MVEEAPTSFLIVFGTVCLLSLTSLFFLFQKHIGGEPLLSYETRRRVPWGPLVALLAVAMPLFGVLAYLATPHAPVPQFEDISVQDPAESLENPSLETQLTLGWGNFAFMVMFVFGLAAWIATFFRADARDLGLPTSAKQALKDIGIGCFATVASLLPIYAVQLTLINALSNETKHPLVEQLEADHSPAMLLLGIAMAVIAAPLFEEFTFRLLLQGWLERHEDELLGYTATERQPAIDELSELDAPRENDGPFITQVAQESEIEEMNSADTRPKQGWIAALPHGWTPIVLSGVAFGLAHVGHGVAPISLVLFGMVLGYLYQRTHRLLPSITAHMVFNGYSMVLLWLQLGGPPPG